MTSLPAFVSPLFAAASGNAPKLDAGTEDGALAVLKSDAPLHEKAHACQQLAVIGGPASVPALAAVLDQEQLADYARSGLEGIRDPAAGTALREALGRLAGRPLAGVVNSLGVRRERAALPALQALVFDLKRGVAAEAVASLGMIGTPDAAQTLQKVLGNGPAELREPAAHASFVAADHLAKEGQVSAARDLLTSVVRALPSGYLATVAQRQAAALSNVAARQSASASLPRS